MQFRRVNPGSWAVVVCTTAIWVLAWLFGGSASDWDAGISSVLRPDRYGWQVQLAWVITWFGDGLFLVPLAIAAGGGLLWRKRAREALALLGVVAAVRIAVVMQKGWFGRARPDVEQWVIEYSNSFPSAHAANSAATFLALAILMTPSRTAIIAAAAASAAVGASRVVLGVHWPSDVVGGWAFGALATLPLWRLRPLRHLPPPPPPP